MSAEAGQEGDFSKSTVQTKSQEKERKKTDIQSLEELRKQQQIAGSLSRSRAYLMQLKRLFCAQAFLDCCSGHPADKFG